MLHRVFQDSPTHQHVHETRACGSRGGITLYQPRFLDTWTLLSFIGAATERIRLFPDVAALPLRPPAMLAKAAASLDLLTQGHVELGLGAGASWEPIAAMGGRAVSRSPCPHVPVHHAGTVGADGDFPWAPVPSRPPA